jgi:hypothetical protein
LRSLFFYLPRQPAQPALNIAGGADELVLQIDFGFASVTRRFETMSCRFDFRLPAETNS